PRDDAERAAVVAAFRDLEVGDVTRGRERARRLGVERAARQLRADDPVVRLAEQATRHAGDVAPLAGAEDGVDCRELVEERAARALRQTAGDDQAAQPAAFLQL